MGVLHQLVPGSSSESGHSREAIVKPDLFTAAAGAQLVSGTSTGLFEKAWRTPCVELECLLHPPHHS